LKSTNVKRNICIGLIDGIIIPLVLAAVLSRLQTDHRTVVIACLAVGVAGAITMTTGSYIEGKKYEPSEFNFTSAMVIGLAYLAGSLIVSTPFLAIPLIMDAFYVSAAFSSIILLACGRMESRLHGANPLVGALRVWLTGLVAAGLAFLVAGLF
jgi:VIT1/CCC1 family predicted Fe2+/Mn2+ transporter